jgi:hypothetical protein
MAFARGFLSKLSAHCKFHVPFNDSVQAHSRAYTWVRVGKEVTIIFLLAEEGRWLPDRFLAAATGVFSLI